MTVGPDRFGVTLVFSEMGVAAMGALLEMVLVGMVAIPVEGVVVDLAASWRASAGGWR